MKNDRILAAWNTVEPDGDTDARMLSAILSANRMMRERTEKAMPHTKRILIPAAACLALLAAAGVGVYANRTGRTASESDAGAGFVDSEVDIDGTVPGGSLPEGMDPVTASIAVFPGNESLANVENAVMNGISEADARRVPELGAHLPAVVPEGYRFRHAALYETTMRDGTVYRLLRVSYSFGGISVNDSPEDEPDTLDYSVSLLSYVPKTEVPVYPIDALPDDLAGQGFLYVVYGDLYVGIDVGDLTADEILPVLRSVSR